MPEGLDEAQIQLFRRVGRVQFPVLLLELDAQVHFSWKLLGREPESAEELLAVYGALLAAGTDLESRGIATMIRGVRESTVRRYMRLFEAEPALRAANDALVHFARSHAIVDHWGSGYEASSDLMSLDASRQIWNARVDPKRRTHGIGTYTTRARSVGHPLRSAAAVAAAPSWRRHRGSRSTTYRVDLPARNRYPPIWLKALPSSWASICARDSTTCASSGYTYPAAGLKFQSSSRF